MDAQRKTEFYCSAQFSKKLNLSENFNTPTLFYHCNNDKSWTVNFISSACREILEYSPEKFMSHEISLGDLTADSDKDLVWATVQNALQKESTFELIYQIVTLSNKIKIIHERGEGVFNEHGKLIELVGFLSDITKYYEIYNKDSRLALKVCAKEIYKLASSMKKEDDLRLLSEREIETLVYLCQGKTMKEIALIMKISPRTVEMNIKHSKEKLLCHSQVELRNLFFMTESGRRLLLNLS